MKNLTINSEQTIKKSLKTEHPLYTIWRTMLSRCENPNATGYEYYGGRGVIVCERWHDFEAFVFDVGERPSLNHTLDRIDSNGNYEPGNCRWATRQEQNQNRREFQRRDVCRKGHPMTEQNTYQRKDGYRACRDCMLLADKRYRAKKKVVVVK